MVLTMDEPFGQSWGCHCGKVWTVEFDKHHRREADAEPKGEIYALPRRGDIQEAR